MPLSAPLVLPAAPAPPSSPVGPVGPVSEVLTVPVRVAADGGLHLQVLHLGSGERVVVAFTTLAQARAVLGEHQLLVDLGRGALQALVEPLGIGVRLDPERVLRPARRTRVVA